ncbi:MAG: EamA family transporter [Spirochaeta sp. LUC14_002_19_P3]|nr:MAG: EamA family transporter [Spirochaeta sp. LUC14_002_19_P3]
MTAAIWGFGFIAQRLGMNHLGPYGFNSFRFLLGALSLLPVCLVQRKRSAEKINRRFWLIGCIAGLALFGGATLQQVGLQFTTVGKTGFITGLYIVIVPIIGLTLKQHVGGFTISGILAAAVGLYFLSIKDGFSISRGDALILAGALFWAVHVQVLGHTGNWNPLQLAALQYAVCAVLNLALAFSFETVSLNAIVSAALPIVYSGLFSVGVAFTIQVIAQKHIDPSRAAILLSLEAVFAVLGGWLVLHETLTLRELLGCALMFAGMLLSQLQNLRKNPQKT